MTQKIHIEIEERKAGLFFAKSPDMKGFFDAKYSREEIESSAAANIRDLYLAAGENVAVTRTDDPGLVFSVESLPLTPSSA